MNNNLCCSFKLTYIDNNLSGDEFYYHEFLRIFTIIYKYVLHL